MSIQTRPQPTTVTVCDLCDEPIVSDNNATRASLVYGYGGTPRDTPDIKAWYLLWDPRNWPGFRAPNRHDDDPRWKRRQYDFHTECLIRVVEAAMRDKQQPADGAGGDDQ